MDLHLAVFTDMYWLADEDTRSYYQNFLEFIEICERCLSESLPRDVLMKLEHTEETVRPFYEHIEVRLSELQLWTKGASFWKAWLFETFAALNKHHANPVSGALGFTER